MPIDYLALMNDRAKKADAARRPIRYPICLDLDLLADLQEAEEEHRQLVVDAIGEDDQRLGSLSPINAAAIAAELRVEKIKQQVAEHSVLGVFRVPTATRQAELHDQLAVAQRDRPDEQNAVGLASAKDTVSECFVRFEDFDHTPIAVLNREHMIADLEFWPEGMLVDLAKRISDASMGVPDIPKSGRSSRPSQPSAAT